MVAIGGANDEGGIYAPTQAYNLNLLSVQGMVWVGDGYKSRRALG
jgi:hypothetical protein